MSTHKYEGGLERVKIGLVKDTEGLIVRSGMKKENSGYSNRSVVLLDTAGVVVARMVMDLPRAAQNGERWEHHSQEILRIIRLWQEILELGREAQEI